MDPGGINAAASSALIRSCAREGFNILVLVEAIETYTFLFLMGVIATLIRDLSGVLTTPTTFDLVGEQRLVR
jgi:hypothetical protein